MKAALAQIDPVVGDFEGNFKKIKNAYERACDQQARFILFPELCVSGYTLYDLLDHIEIFNKTQSVLLRIAQLTEGKKTALIVGHLSREGGSQWNEASVFENGVCVFSQKKTHLPTYDVFDEKRYFEPASSHGIWNCDGAKILISICEDLWESQNSELWETYEALHPDLILSLSASPYEWNKRKRRESLHSEVSKKLNAPLIYVNQVDATDEILFDGGSFFTDEQGEIKGRFPFFETSFGVVDLSSKTWIEPPQREPSSGEFPKEIQILMEGLIYGIRSYFKKTGFQKAIIGLSGGIDSAVVATLAVQALGAENVLGIAMPSQHSSSHSLSDADTLAKNLRMTLEIRPIKFLNSVALREFSEGRGSLNEIAQENLQSRLRGLLLMTLANHIHGLVITTGNKSEMATGYATLYGDMCGAIAPLGDVVKTRVYELAHQLNHSFGSCIPISSIEKPPSAELRPGQVDEESLPPYPLLDQILESYLEKEIPIHQIKEQHIHPELEARLGKDWFDQLIRKIHLNEYKRAQAAPVFKVTSKAFGIGRRIPIARYIE